jgi:hypothetical protein
MEYQYGHEYRCEKFDYEGAHCTCRTIQDMREAGYDVDSTEMDEWPEREEELW